MNRKRPGSEALAGSPATTQKRLDDACSDGGTNRCVSSNAAKPPVGLLQKMFGVGFLSERGRPPCGQTTNASSGSAAGRDASPGGMASEDAIQSRVMNSAAGKAMQAMDSLKDILHGVSDFCGSNATTVSINTSGLSFPEIAVVGQESTGKSSVLERITMLPLFPRGSDITTRMAVRLKLRHIGTGTALVEFCHSLGLPSDPNAVYIRACMIDRHTEVAQGDSTDFEVIHRRDDYLMSGMLTERITKLMKAAATAPDGTNLGVNDRWILELELRSRQLPNLVVVDLPGIVGSPVAGEPWDLPERTQRLVSEYTKKEDCLVLIVCEGTSPSVRNSKAFDVVLGTSDIIGTPGVKADKAIGVLTKCDGCATGSQLERLRSRVHGTARDTPYLKFGYVAVVNRDSHDEATTGPIPLNRAAMAEQTWFKNHLPDLLESRKAGGTRLVEKLVEMLTGYVRMTWAPKALVTLGAIHSNLLAELESLGQPMPAEPQHQVLLARTAIKEMVTAIQTTASGRPAELRQVQAAQQRSSALTCAVTAISLTMIFGTVPAGCSAPTQQLCRAKLDNMLASVHQRAITNQDGCQQGDAGTDIRGYAGDAWLLETIVCRLEEDTVAVMDRMARGAVGDGDVPQVLSLIQETIQDSYQNADVGLRLQRFPRLKEVICQAIHRLFTARLRGTTSTFRRRLQLYSDLGVLQWFNTLLAPTSGQQTDPYQTMLKRATELVRQTANLMIHHVDAALNQALFCLPFSDSAAMADSLIANECSGVSDLLREDEETAKNRVKLNNSIREIVGARQAIQELDTWPV